MKFLTPRIVWFAFICCLLFITINCKPKTKVIKSPKHYDFSKVLTKKLDPKLKEISGLAWDHERDVFLAHYDEAGKMYELDEGTYAVLKEFTFGVKGDYEDIAIYKGTPYILRSDGMITQIVRDSSGNVRGVEAGKIGITGKVDFETMYADTARKALVIICKNCDMDSKAQVSAFAYYPDSIGFDNEPVYRINADTIKKMSPHKTSKFQPSAAGIHPKLRKLFIISSAASQLVVCDLNGNPEKVYELGEKLFPQPEGLTFRNDGSMYISNEGVTGRSTILKFVYTP